MESWCHGTVRPCQPLSPCTLLPRAVFSMAAIAGAAAREDKKDEEVKVAGEECMRISARSWIIKPGLVLHIVLICIYIVYVCVCVSNLFAFRSLAHQTHPGQDCREEVGSAVSDEWSSSTLSSAYPSDALIGCAQGTVRKAGALAVKNFLVHKKNKKVEPATKRKWKHYWVSLKGGPHISMFPDGINMSHNSKAFVLIKILQSHCERLCLSCFCPVSVCHLH